MRKVRGTSHKGRVNAKGPRRVDGGGTSGRVAASWVAVTAAKAATATVVVPALMCNRMKGVSIGLRSTFSIHRPLGEQARHAGRQQGGDDPAVGGSRPAETRLHDVNLVAAHATNAVGVAVVHPTGAAAVADKRILSHGSGVNREIAAAPRTRQIHRERKCSSEKLPCGIRTRQRATRIRQIMSTPLFNHDATRSKICAWPKWP